MTSTLCLSLALAGVASHVCFFHRGEHHMHGATYVKILSLLLPAMITFEIISHGTPVHQALVWVMRLTLSYLSGIYLSLLTYRTAFDPLRKFPGPFGAKISSLWYSLQLGNRDAHKHLLALHDKYGDFVRLGTSDLSIIHPKAVQVIYGPQSRCTKGDWYDLTLPMVSMQTTRNRALHDQRRRIWSKAFGDKNLRGYETRIGVFQDELIAKLEASQDQAVNLTKWINWYSFDVMGDLAFGRSFDMLKKSEVHWGIELLTEGTVALGFMLPSWLFRILTAIPFASGRWWMFIKYCWDNLDQRMERGADIPDILSTLLEPYSDGSRPKGAELDMLRGDTQLIIVAGSDTTATTLASLFYELVRKPACFDILRKEIKPCVASDGSIQHHRIQHLEYLNAVINETLRLHPPVPAMLARKTPPEGIYIEDTYIPGNTTVWCPPYVVGRSEKAYKNARSFLPERWSNGSTLVKEKSAYAPFSAGPYNCIGKPLALLTLRTTVAKLIMNFDIRFADGDNGEAFERDSKVHFTSAPGDLHLLFRKRDWRA